MGVKLNPFTGDLQLFNGGGIEWAIQGILDNFSPVSGTNIIPIGSLIDGSASTNYSRVDLQEDNPNSWRVGNKLIVPEGLSGWYLITFALSHPTDPVLGSNSQVALGDFRVGIRLNGDTKNQAFSVDAGTGTSEAGSFALPIKLQEADEVEFEFNCNSATNEDFIIRASVITLGGVATTNRVVELTSVDWTNFTPSVSAITTAPTLATTHKKQANFKVVGKSLHIIWSYSHILATGATGGSGDYLFPLPSGYTIDVSKLDLGSLENTFAYGTPVGHGNVMQDFAWGELTVVVHDNTNLKLIVTNDNGTQVFKFISSGIFGFNVNNQKLLFTAEIPIF